MKKELAHRDRILRKRRPVLWPGIWTLSALAGTYGILAYLDVKAGIPSSDGSHLPARAQLPQNWELTPEIFRTGLAAGWNELDNLTIGIIVASVALHLLVKSRPLIRSKLYYMTNGSRWTAFTYPLLHNTRKSLALGTASLIWYLPSVVYYFDGDLFHTTAFLASTSLITSYLAHLACRINLVQATICLGGPSGLICALFGIYCVAYANEKLWMPASFVFRLDAWHWGVFFWVSQACILAQTSSAETKARVVVRYAGVLCKNLLIPPRFTCSISCWG